MEYIKEIEVIIKRFSNKYNITEILKPYEDETMEEYIERINEKLREIFIDL